MDALFRRLQQVNVGAFAVLVIIFLALLSEGANSAARASLLSVLLIAALMSAVGFVPRRALNDALSANWLAILAALALLIWSAASVSQASFLPTHPLWRQDPGAAMSLSPYRTIEGAVAFLGPCAAFLLGALAAPGRSSRDWVGRWTVALTILYALFGLYHFLSGQAGPRLDVGVSSANVAAALFGVLALVAATLLVRAGRGRLDEEQAAQSLPPAWRWASFALKAPVSLAAFILACACLLLTASRGGLIATFAAFLVFATALASQGLKQQPARSGALAAPVLALLAVFAFLFLRGGEDVIQRFALASEDMEIRQLLADTHWERFQERPLLGHGLNTYHELNALSGAPDNWRALRSPGSAHNIFIQALEETGLIGFGLMALMFASPLIRAFARVAKGRSGVEWAAVALASSALLLLHGLVDFALQTPAVAALFCFLLGASVGRSQRERT